MNYKLSDICDFVKGKIEVVTLNRSTYISTENMLPNRGGICEITSLPTTPQVQVYGYNDTLVSNIRPYFKKIWKACNDGGCSNDVLVFRAKEGISPDYLYYVLSDDKFFEYAMATSKGTKMPRGDKTAIMQYLIPKADYDTQCKIASILKSMDQRIHYNKIINDNLEAQAQAIFKSWFVDFEPFNLVRPDDWINGTIQDLATEIICGKTPSTKKSEYYGDDIPFITIPDMHDCVYAVSTSRKLSMLGAETQHNKMLSKNSVCVSCIGTAGLVILVPAESQTNQQINSIIPKVGISPYYIYLLMQTLSELINKLGQSGSTIVNLNKVQFSKMEATIPSDSVMRSFDEMAKPIFETILSNQQESIQLANLRDALLPKLMSGELDVSEIDL